MYYMTCDSFIMVSSTSSQFFVTFQTISVKSNHIDVILVQVEVPIETSNLTRTRPNISGLVSKLGSIEDFKLDLGLKSYEEVYKYVQGISWMQILVFCIYMYKTVCGAESAVFIDLATRDHKKSLKRNRNLYSGANKKVLKEGDT